MKELGDKLTVMEFNQLVIKGRVLYLDDFRIIDGEKYIFESGTYRKVSRYDIY